MSSQENQGPLGGQPGAGAPSEEERSEIDLRAAYEAELSRITVIDMISQAAVSLLNIAARRLAPDPSAGPGAPGGGRDLEQVRDGIDAVRALLEILERRIPQEVRPLRDALSQLQMAYAAEVRGAEAPAAAPGPAPPAAAGQAPAGEGDGGAGEGRPEQGEQDQGPGPAQSSGRLWVPGS